MSQRLLIGRKRLINLVVRVRVKADRTGVVTEGVKRMSPFEEIAAATEAMRMKEKPPEDENLEPFHVAHLLSKMVEKERINSVILGKEAADGDANHRTARLLAGFLDWPQATFTSKIDAHSKISREVDAVPETARVKLPPVRSADFRRNADPHYATLPKIIMVGRMERRRAYDALPTGGLLPMMDSCLGRSLLFTFRPLPSYVGRAWYSAGNIRTYSIWSRQNDRLTESLEARIGDLQKLVEMSEMRVQDKEKRVLDKEKLVEMAEKRVLDKEKLVEVAEKRVEEKEEKLREMDALLKIPAYVLLTRNLLDWIETEKGIERTDRVNGWQQFLVDDEDGIAIFAAVTRRRSKLTVRILSKAIVRYRDKLNGVVHAHVTLVPIELFGKDAGGMAFELMHECVKKWPYVEPLLVAKL